MDNAYSGALHFAVLPRERNVQQQAQGRRYIYVYIYNTFFFSYRSLGNTRHITRHTLTTAATFSPTSVRSSGSMLLRSRQATTSNGQQQQLSQNDKPLPAMLPFLNTLLLTSEVRHSHRPSCCLAFLFFFFFRGFQLVELPHASQRFSKRTTAKLLVPASSDAAFPTLVFLVLSTFQANLALLFSASFTFSCLTCMHLSI